MYIECVLSVNLYSKSGTKDFLLLAGNPDSSEKTVILNTTLQNVLGIPCAHIPVQSFEIMSPIPGRLIEFRPLSKQEGATEAALEYIGWGGNVLISFQWIFFNDN